MVEDERVNVWVGNSSPSMVSRSTSWHGSTAPKKRDRIGRRLLRAICESDSERYILGAAKVLVSADFRQQEIDLKKAEPQVKLDDDLDIAIDPPAEDSGDPGEVPG